MFAKVVELYRALGRPAISGDAFSFRGQTSQEALRLIDEVKRLPPHFGEFVFENIENGIADVEFHLPASESGRFHSTLNSFIASTPSLNFGAWPAEFYICSMDFYSADESAPTQILALRKLCRFIKALSQLASDHEDLASPLDGHNRLLFVVAADGRSPAKTLAITIEVEEHLLIEEISHIRLLELIVSNSMKDEMHIEERRAIMRHAIAEVLSSLNETSGMFAALVQQWRQVLVRYRHNFLAFVSQYSFEKVRKEIATAQIDHATKLSAVLGDIAGKLLALPVSFAAIVLLRKANTREEFWLAFAGLFVVSIIFVAVLINQWMQVRRIRSSFDLIFGQYDETAFPKKLRLPISTAKKDLSRQYFILAGTFLMFGVLSLIPAGAAFTIWWTTLPMSLIDVCLLLAR